MPIGSFVCCVKNSRAVTDSGISRRPVFPSNIRRHKLYTFPEVQRGFQRVQFPGTGYGIAVFDVDPGEHGGKTTITMNYYHAPGANQTPTPNYELFETITLAKPRN